MRSTRQVLSTKRGLESSVFSTESVTYDLLSALKVRPDTESVPQPTHCGKYGAVNHVHSACTADACCPICRSRNQRRTKGKQLPTNRSAGSKEYPIKKLEIEKEKSWGVINPDLRISIAITSWLCRACFHRTSRSLAGVTSIQGYLQVSSKEVCFTEAFWVSRRISFCAISRHLDVVAICCELSDDVDSGLLLRALRRHPDRTRTIRPAAEFLPR